MIFTSPSAARLRDNQVSYGNAAGRGEMPARHDRRNAMHAPSAKERSRSSSYERDCVRRFWRRGDKGGRGDRQVGFKFSSARSASAIRQTSPGSSWNIPSILSILSGFHRSSWSHGKMNSPRAKAKAEKKLSSQPSREVFWRITNRSGN